MHKRINTSQYYYTKLDHDDDDNYDDDDISYMESDIEKKRMKQSQSQLAGQGPKNLLRAKVILNSD